MVLYCVRISAAAGSALLRRKLSTNSCAKILLPSPANVRRYDRLGTASSTTSCLLRRLLGPPCRRSLQRRCLLCRPHRCLSCLLRSHRHLRCRCHLRSHRPRRRRRPRLCRRQWHRRRFPLIMGALKFSPASTWCPVPYCATPAPTPILIQAIKIRSSHKEQLSQVYYYYYHESLNFSTVKVS